MRAFTQRSISLRTTALGYQCREDATGAARRAGPGPETWRPGGGGAGVATTRAVVKTRAGEGAWLWVLLDAEPWRAAPASGAPGRDARAATPRPAAPQWTW